MARKPRVGFSAQTFLAQPGSGRTFKSWPAKTYRLLAARNDWDECSSYWRISGRLVCLVSPLDTAPEYAQTRFSTDTPADGLLENPDRRLLVRKNRLVYATHPHSLSRQRSPRGKGGLRGILSANVVSFGTEFHSRHRDTPAPSFVALGMR